MRIAEMSCELKELINGVFAKRREFEHLKHQPEIFLEILLRDIIEAINNEPEGNIRAMVDISGLRAENLIIRSLAMEDGARDLLNR